MLGILWVSEELMDLFEEAINDSGSHEGDEYSSSTNPKLLRSECQYQFHVTEIITDRFRELLIIPFQPRNAILTDVRSQEALYSNLNSNHKMIIFKKLLRGVSP
jgi:hypothetical protein